MVKLADAYLISLDKPKVSYSNNVSSYKGYVVPVKVILCLRGILTSI